MARRSSSSTAPDLSEEEAAWAAYRADRSIAARNRLVELYQPVAARMAKRSMEYARSVSSEMANPDDILAIAQEGLILAVERFDPSRQVSFPAYASLRITGHIRDALRKDDYLSRRTRRLVQAYRGERSQELSEEQRRTAARVVGQRPLRQVEVSASEDWTHPAMDSVETEALASVEVAEVLGKLKPAERLVLECRYLQGMSLSAIGVLLSTSESRACQIHLAALRHLREVAATAG